MRKILLQILTVFMLISPMQIQAEDHDHSNDHEHTQENTQETTNNQENNHKSSDTFFTLDEASADVQEVTFYCDKEEHFHTEECFDTYKVLICENQQEDHVHNEDCFKEFSFLICEKEEHIHDENCLDENYVEPEIIIDKEAEEAKHAFEELLHKAINEEDNYYLNCEKTEHTHTADCFELFENLICEKEENLDKESKDYHEHNEECYDNYYVIVCEEKEEHTHSEDCISVKEEEPVVEEEINEEEIIEEEAPGENLDEEKAVEDVPEVITQEYLDTLIEGVDYITSVPDDLPSDESIDEDTPLRSLSRAPLLLLGAGGIEIKSLVVQMFYGAKPQGGKYVWDANFNTSGHRFSYRINYETTGVFEIDEVGAVTFTIPKQILRDRDNNLSGTYEMSIPSKRDVDSGEELDRDVKFAYYEQGDNIIIYNFRKVSAGENGYIELSYLTNKPATSYKDMGKSDDFSVTMNINYNGTNESKYTHSVPVYINTNAKIKGVKKGPSGYPSRYSSWQTSWGTAEADANNYYYLLWTIRTEVTEPVTQPYNFKLVDTLKTGNGSVVGYRFSGQSTFTTNNTVTNQTSDGYRYDYVLTKHPKSYWQPLTHWEITNSVTATVDPVDQIDADTSSSSQQTYVWNKPVFTIPSGHFNSWKKADGWWRALDEEDLSYKNNIYKTPLSSLGHKNGEYSRYDLDEFQDGNLEYLNNLDWAVWMRGYPYPWTYQGSDPKNPDNYGKIPVKFELIDEGFYLWDEAVELNKNLVLDYNDFQIDTITYEIRNSHVTGFDEENQKYIMSSNVFDNDDILNFYGKFENGDWVKIATYKPSDSSIWFDSNYVESMTTSKITLKDNCIAYKVDTTNAHYYTEVNTVPNGRLKNSTKVMNFVQGKQSVGILNEQTANFYKNDGSLIVQTGEGDSNYLRVTQKDSYIFKDSVSATNNVKKKNYVITWKVGMTEQYIVGEGEINYINQESGVFYDLLPVGSNLDINSVSVRAGNSSRFSSAVDTAEKMKNRTGQFLPETAYTVEQIPNYKNTGRTLLIVKVKEEAKYYDIFFDTVHSWDSISDWGNDVYNPVAYETGNDKIKYGTNNDGGQISEKQLMANLPSEAQGEKFIYAEAEFDIATITAASTGLTKKVKALDDKDFSYDTITTNDGDYEYRWRIASSHTSKTKNIILFDSMENYVVEGKASDWHGTLESIDLSQVVSMGVNPIVYYSTIENLDINENHDLTDSNVWQRLTDSTDLSSVRALALDARKKTNGQDFVLEEGQSLTVILHMRAPHGAEAQGTYPEAYNNIYLSDTVIGLNGQPQDFFIHQDYTTVRFVITEDLSLKKLSAEDETTPIKDIKFRLKGTSDYGTEEDRIVATDLKGEILFKDIEKGSYILSEYEATVDWLLNPAEYVVTVDAEGEISITGQDNSNFISFDSNEGKYTLTLKNNPRVHGDVTLLKRREGDGADDIEVKQMLANAEIRDIVTYNDTEYMIIDKTNTKVKLEETREMTTKYAVQIYGIEQDTLEDGSAAGLTFGPALGQDFMNTYISHTPSGNTTLGNAHRCVHDDTWEEIVYWNNVDPHVYEQCVGNKCTHSVELSLSDALKKPNFIYGGSEYGDGVGQLCYEMQDNALIWNAWGQEYGGHGPSLNNYAGSYLSNGWGTSNIRAVLNGVDSLTITDTFAEANNITSNNALISAFPTVLQNAIGARKTSYDSVYNQKTEANLRTSYDKLWLLSPNEIANVISNTNYNHPLEAPNGKYQKFIGNNLNLSESPNPAFRVYRQSTPVGRAGNAYGWWLRSLGTGDVNGVLIVYNNGDINISGEFAYFGISPCFSLARNANTNSSNNNDLWVDYTLKPQTPISDTTFKLSGTSDYGTDTTKLETTNTAGRVTFTDLELGTYTLEEVIPNEDYVLNTTKWTVKIDENGNASIIEPEDENLKDRLYTVEKVGNNYVVFNEPRYWNFTLRKIDKENETIWIQGAEFTLSGISDLGTEYIEVVESNENGRVVFNRIEKGTYILKETKAPTGVTETGAQGGNRNYIADPKEYIVKIDNQGNVTIDGLNMNQYDDFVVKNDRAYDGKITIVKKWEDNLTNDERPEPVVHLSTNEPSWKRGITVTKVWEGDSAEDRPEDITVHLGEKYKYYEIGKVNDQTRWSTDTISNYNYNIKSETDYMLLNINGNLYHNSDQLNESDYNYIVNIAKNSNTPTLIPNAYFTTNRDMEIFGNGVYVAKDGDNYLIYLKDKCEEGVSILSLIDFNNNPIINNKYVADGRLLINGTDCNYDSETIKNHLLEVMQGDRRDGIFFTDTLKFIDSNNITYDVIVDYFWNVWGDHDSWLLQYRKPDYLIADTTKSTNWTKNADNTWTYTFDILLEDENADKEFYVWEEDSVNRYKVINNSNNPVKVVDTKATVTNEKIRIFGKYAVSIWGIGQDIDENGNTMGLTFGPAIGEDYTNSFKSHIPSGNTSSGNAHRCIHDDDWNLIIEWNNVDPYVYEQCVAENCTHSVELHEAGDTIVNPRFVANGTGDGATTLHYELLQYSGTDVRENLRWHPNNNMPNNASNYGTNYGGWGASRIRAMLNGADELTDLGDGTASKLGGTDIYALDASSDIHKSASIYTSTNNLLVTFPQELQDAIGKRATKYDSVYNSKTEANLKTSYDKLWLLSPIELNYAGTNSQYTHALEGVAYQKIIQNSQSINNRDNSYYNAYKFSSNTATSGINDNWWLRSSYSSAYNVLAVSNEGDLIANYSSWNYGVSPCFSLDTEYEFSFAKYAVSIWGIGQDIDENGNTMGLTFGPAIGADYTNSYKDHTPTGTTSSGNPHRCVHNDDWDIIIEWNRVDPYVYEQCVAENCTHSVILHKAGETIVNPNFEARGTGDGASTLYYEVLQYNGSTTVSENLRWHPNNNMPNNTSSNGTNYGGWGASRVRAMLNGADELTDLGDGTAAKPGGTDIYASSANSDTHKSASIYTSTNNLLTCFPKELQVAIGKRATKYDSVYDSKTETNLMTTYDKLWLLSPAELNYTGTTTAYQHPLEGTVYQKIAQNTQSLADSNSNYYRAYRFNSNTATSGAASWWWLRSSYGSGTFCALYIDLVDYIRIFDAGYPRGISPCFSLSR